MKFYCLNLASVEPPDFQGLPYIENGITKYGRPEWFSEENEFSVVLFNAPKLSFREKDKVVVEGKIKEYKGAFEVLADRIEMIKGK